MNIAVVIGEIAYISRSKLLEGLIYSARKDGVNIILFTSEGFMHHELEDYSYGEYNIFRLPDFDRYDGIIVDITSIQNAEMRQYLIGKINASKVPCVSINTGEVGDYEIYFDNEKGFVDLIEHLVVDHGYSDIYYISGPFGNRDSIQRLDILKNVMLEHGLELPNDNVFEGDFNFESGKLAVDEYIKSGKTLPDVFVAANDFMAIGALEELKANGISVPNDVAVTGFDNSEIASYTTPMLTTVDRGEYEAGILAYNKLMDAAEKRSIDMIYSTARIGRSCGCENVVDADINASQSVVNIRTNMDQSLDLIKGITVDMSEMEGFSDFRNILEKYIERIGMEYFYFCQCGSRQSYYDELEILASGKSIERDDTVYQDSVWCPIAYENGEWNSYPSFDKSLLFPPGSKHSEKGGYYIVMPIHKGRTCIGYGIIGNYRESLSGRVLQHLALKLDEAIGTIRKNDLMTTMLAQINQKWQYDQLTGLYNRSGLVKDAETTFEGLEGETIGTAVYFFDLDNLKTINDTDGHDAGDEYIKSMADCLRGLFDERDIICRYGGDEYVVIRREASEDAAEEKCCMLQKEISKKLSSSVGYSFGSVSSMDELKVLIEIADKKMYEQKRSRKNKQKAES